MNYTLFVLSFLSLSSTGSGQSPNPPILRKPPVPNPSTKLAKNPFDIPSIDEVTHDKNAKKESITTAAEVSTTPVNLSEIPPRPTDGIMPGPTDRIMPNRTDAKTPRPTDEIRPNQTERIVPRPTQRTTRPAEGIISRPTILEIQSPRSNVDTNDVEISVGNVQVVITDKLRNIMREYEITSDEIRRVMELYTQGGSSSITKRRVNPVTGLQEVITLDFDILTRPSPGSETGRPSADPIPGGKELSSTVGVSETTLKYIQETGRFHREQIQELDAQFEALNMAYRRGEVKQKTKQKLGRVNRERRQKHLSERRSIQQEINDRTGTGRLGPQIPGSRITVRPGTQEIGEQVYGPQVSGQQVSGPLVGQQNPGSQRPGQQLPSTTSLSPSSLEALRLELINIRAREMSILNQLREVSQRLQNRGIQHERNLPLMPARQRINFGSRSNVPQVRRTLRGSLTRQKSYGRPMAFYK